MPLFKYKCEECGHIFEELVFGNAKIICPNCKSDSVIRHYQGKCYFGSNAKGSAQGASSGGGCSCKGSCGSCGGCH